MSYHTFFAFVAGLKDPMQAPPGTLQKIRDHVAHVEETLGYQTEQYLDNPKQWRTTNPAAGVTDEVFCEVADDHNRFVRWFYNRLSEWHFNPPADGDTITPEDAATFWHGLQLIDVPAERWTKEYYRARMETLYEVMRGRECDGITFDTKALTPRQAAGVIILFSEFLDHDDIRLDVPVDCDSLASSYDGEYSWCEKCGAVTYEHAAVCRKRKCPLRDEFGREG